MQQFWHENRGVRYLLCQIDVPSKVAHVIPLRNKKAETVIGALNRLFDVEAKTVPKFISSDRGKEFTADDVVALFRRRGITACTMLNPETGAPVVARFIRTLKMRLYRYMDLNKTKRYINVLPRIVSAYNRSWDSSIGMAPADVRRKHEEAFVQRLFGPDSRLGTAAHPFRYRYALWQLARVYLQRDPYLRGFHQQYSDEIFAVCRREPTLPPIYRLCPLKLGADGMPEQNRKIDGSYYAAEVVPVMLPGQTFPPLVIEGEALDEEEDWLEDEKENVEPEEPTPPPPPLGRRAYLPRQAKTERR